MCTGFEIPLHKILENKKNQTARPQLDCVVEWSQASSMSCGFNHPDKQNISIVPTLKLKHTSKTPMLELELDNTNAVSFTFNSFSVSVFEIPHYQ